MHWTKLFNDQKPILHPIFFGLFPIYSLLSVNLVWAGFWESLVPACVVLGIVLVLWLALWPVLPQAHKRAVVISLFWAPFYGYGAALDGVRDLLNFQELLAPGYLIAAAALALAVAGGLVYGLRKAPWTFERATGALNRVSALLLCVALAWCGLALARQAATRVKAPAVAEDGTPYSELYRPNIYFIILDSYPRTDYLKAYFDYDNTAFLDTLRGRGFYVADRSRSNYPNTLPSLASTLNLDYLDSAMAVEGWEDARYPALLSQIQDNIVVPKLKAAGYEFVAIASGVFPTELGNADRFIHPAGWRPTEFHRHLVEMTPLRSIYNRMKKRRWHHRVPFVFDALKHVRNEGKPMFVFAHILAPHLPHAYDMEGNVLLEFPPYKEGWRQMTDFVNKEVLEVVESIQEHEPNSVIVIEGDHGPRTTWQSTFESTLLPWEGTWEDYVRDRCANLSTYYFPDQAYEGLLYPEITPVNTFRVIFNKYLHTDYDLLEDVVYLSPQGSAEVVRVPEVY